MTTRTGLFIGVFFAAILFLAAAPQMQAQSAELVVLDQNKAVVTGLVDGDAIQLRIKLPNRILQSAQSVFDRRGKADCVH